MHYVPEDGVYVYFRYDGKQTVMCVMNTSDNNRTIDFSRYAERTKGFGSARNVITDETLRTDDNIQINGTEMLVLELLK
jgi:neopullulanase